MRCSSCKRELPAAEFPPSVTARGGGWCRACYRERARRARSTPEGREAKRESNRRARATPEGLEASREASRESKLRARATPEGREAARAWSRLSRYGLTEEAFAALIAAQGGRCAICGTDEPGGRTWHVDHDHACCAGRVTCGGKCIRGLLCHRCNVGVGMFLDNAETLHAAGDYLEKFGNRARASDSLTAQ